LLDVLPLFAAQVWIPQAPEKISEMWFGLNYACVPDLWGWIFLILRSDSPWFPTRWCACTLMQISFFSLCF
jgi:hypothetical protein